MIDADSLRIDRSKIHALLFDNYFVLTKRWVYHYRHFLRYEIVTPVTLSL